MSYLWVIIVGLEWYVGLRCLGMGWLFGSNRDFSMGVGYYWRRKFVLGLDFSCL